MVCLVVLRCLSVRCVGRTVQLHRRLLKELPSLVLQALPSRMNEKEYSYMKDIVLCGVVVKVVFVSLSLSLCLSARCASLFDGTMRRSLVIVEAMNPRLRRCRRNCGPPGLIASTIAGALCCALFCWLAVD